MPSTAFLTCELAHSNNPPTGAKIMPIAKKRGSTVLGVRMGLGLESADDYSLLEWPYCHAFNRCCRKAVSAENQSLSIVFRIASAYSRAFDSWASSRRRP